MNFLLIIGAVLLFAMWVRKGEKKALAKRVEVSEEFNPAPSYGSARFAENSDLRKAGLFNKKGLFFGFSPDGRQRLFYQGAGHMLMVCAARGGKLLTVLVSLILQLGRKRSLLVVDPKLEISPIIAKARRRCGKVSVWNPYGMWPDHLKDFPPASVNPVADIERDANCKPDCVKLLSTFWSSPASSPDPHWLNSSQDLAASVLYTLVMYGKESEKNLPTMRTVLTGGNGASIYEFGQYAVTLGDPVCNEGFSRYAHPKAEESRELQSIISTAITETAWIDPVLSKHLTRADFSFMDLKKKAGTTVCIGLPLNRMGDGKAFAMLSGWMLNCALEQGARGSRVKCVAVIDEMSNLGAGPSRQWKDAFANGAGAGGLQIVAVYQDQSQMTEQMGQYGADTVTQNCGLKLYFKVGDLASRNQVSQLAGLREVVNRSHSHSTDLRTGEPHFSDSRSVTSVPLIHPHEVGNLGDDGMIAFCEGVPAVIKGKRKAYTRIESGYGRNPYYNEGLFSRLFN